MVSVALLVSVFLGSQLVAAHPASELAVAVVQEQFKNADLVPAVFPRLNLTGTVTLAFPASTNASSFIVFPNGINKTLEEVQTQPNVSIKGTAASEGALGGPFNVTTEKYTVMIVDVGPVGTILANNSVFPVRHLLQNDLVKSTNRDHAWQLEGSIAPVTAYAPPNPPSGSGPHRYLTLAYLQPANFTPLSDLSGAERTSFDFRQYAASADLTLLAGIYFTVAVGPANASIAATQAVDSTTLPQYTAASTSGDHGHAAPSASASTSASPGGGASGAEKTSGLSRGGAALALVLGLVAVAL